MHTLLAHALRATQNGGHECPHRHDQLMRMPLPIVSSPNPGRLHAFASTVGLDDGHIWMIIDQSGQTVHMSAGARANRDQAIPGSRAERFYQALPLLGRTASARLATAEGRTLTATVAVTWSPRTDPKTGLRLPAVIECGDDRFELDLRDYITASGGQQRTRFAGKETALAGWWATHKGRGWPGSALDFLHETAGPILGAINLAGATGQVIEPESPHAPLVAWAIMLLHRFCLPSRGIETAFDSPADAAAWGAVSSNRFIDDDAWQRIGDLFSNAGISLDLAAMASLWDGPFAPRVAEQAERVADGRAPALGGRFVPGGSPPATPRPALLYLDGRLEQPVELAFASAEDAAAAATSLGADGWAVLVDGRSARLADAISVGGRLADPAVRAADPGLATLDILLRASEDPALHHEVNGYTLRAMPATGLDKQGRVAVYRGTMVYALYAGNAYCLHLSSIIMKRRSSGVQQMSGWKVATLYTSATGRTIEQLYDILAAMDTRVTEQYSPATPRLDAADLRWETVARQVAAHRLVTMCDGAPGHQPGCCGEPLFTRATLRLLFPDVDAAASITARRLACDCALRL